MVLSAISPVSLTKRPDDHLDHDSQATRHLCAGVYLDRGFRDLVLRKVYNDPFHRVAPSYGFDLIPVVQHAWRSWLLDTGHQFIVLLVLGAGWAVNPAATVTAAGWLGFLFAGRVVARAAPDVARRKTRRLVDRLLHRTTSRVESTHIAKQAWMVRLGATGCGVCLATPLLAAAWTDTSSGEVAGAAVWLLVPIAFSAVAAASMRQLLLNSTHHAPTLRSGSLGRRQRVIEGQQSHAYVVYRRPEPERDDDADRPAFLDPYRKQPTIFVGSGQLVHRWLPPMVVQLLPDNAQDMSEEFHKAPFRTHQMVDHLRETMRAVSLPGDAQRLHLRVRDRVFIDEREVPVERGFLRAKPGRARLREIIDDPHGKAQHFLEMRVSASGEVVTTVFLRITVRGRSLSIDMAACALTRTPLTFQAIGLYGENRRAAVVTAALQALWRLPEGVAGVWRVLRAPFTLISAGLSGYDLTLVPLRGVLIGTRVSTREERATRWKEARFDHTGVYDEIKLIEQRLLRSAEDFLRARGVDTSAFEKKAESIINNSGVLNMGGNLEVAQSAVGQGSQVNQPSMSAQQAGDGDS